MTLSFLSIESKISRCSSPQLSMAVMFSDMDAPQRQISSSGGATPGGKDLSVPCVFLSRSEDSCAVSVSVHWGSV